jgi:site-specific DNA-methyltransferase (adenine-specific)
VGSSARAKPPSPGRGRTAPDAGWTVRVGDSLELLATLPAASVDAVVTDPPYGIGFEGHDWDRPALAGPCHLVALGNGSGRGRHKPPRGSDRVQLVRARRYQLWSRAWAAESLRVLKPGGHLVSFGAPRTAHRLACGIEDAGFELRDTLMWLFGKGFPKAHRLDGAWGGWAASLKPAHEPILLARRPLQGTTQQNAERHGTGALNIEACRGDAGRWPPNVVLSHASTCTPRRCDPDCPVETLGPSARFFYAPKISRRERDAGCEGLAARRTATFKIGSASWRRAEVNLTRNFHPTVKPIALMRWLVRLVCAPGGLVLDPFCGSGTTGCAAALERRRFLGIEREPDYAEIARARIAHWSRVAQAEGGG